MAKKQSKGTQMFARMFSTFSRLSPKKNAREMLEKIYKNPFKSPLQRKHAGILLDNLDGKRPIDQEYATILVKKGLGLNHKPLEDSILAALKTTEQQASNSGIRSKPKR